MTSGIPSEKWWFQAATADADRRGLPELKPLLEDLARATALLRRSSVVPAWRSDASGRDEQSTGGATGTSTATSGPEVSGT